MKVISVGRSSSNDIVVPNATVSSTHCQIIQHDDGTFSIADFGSKNGTSVNGRRIHGEMPLRLGDSVTVANTPVQWQNYIQINQVNNYNYHPVEKESVHIIEKASTPLVNIPSNINVNNNNRNSNRVERGDDFSVGFFGSMGKTIGNHLGNTLGCIASIIVVIAIIAIIVLVFKH